LNRHKARRNLGPAGWILLIAAVAAPAGAQERINKKLPPFNVDVMVGWDGCYRPMEWAPIEVLITPNLKDPFEGELELSAQQDDLTTMRILRHVATTPGFPLRVPLAAKLVFGSESCDLTIRGLDGRVKWRKTYDVSSFTGARRQVTVVGVKDVLIGVAGRAGFGLLRLPRRAVSDVDGEQGSVHVRGKVTRMLPVDWTGHAGLDLLVLYDADFTEVNKHQAQAVADWVRNGGRLLIVLGKNVPPAGSAVGKLLPFRPAAPRVVRLPVGQLKSQWGCREADRPGQRKLTPVVACWQLPRRLPGGWRVVTVAGEVLPPAASAPATGGATAEDVPIFVHGPVGFGQVGVLSVDPSAVGGVQGENVARFWGEPMGALLGARRVKIAQSTVTRQDDYNYQFELDPSTAAAANAVLEHLLTIPELRPLSIWVVIGLLLSLAVLIGPVDYLVLKRLNRLPLTWITSAAYLALFSVGAYYGVRALRSGSAQVRVVSVVDGVAGAGRAWRTSYSGIFAPISDDYRLADVREDEWFSSVVPTEGSWLYGYSRRNPTREITCVQREGGNRPASVPINIWSMQCLIGESPAGKMPFAAKLKRDGATLELTITNLADRPLVDGCVRLADNLVMDYDSVPPGKTRTFRRRLSRRRPWKECLGDLDRHPYDTDARRFHGDEAYFTLPTRRRTEAIEAYLSRGAAVVCARYVEDVPADFRLARMKGTYNHVRMARLVVTPSEGPPR